MTTNEERADILTDYLYHVDEASTRYYVGNMPEVEDDEDDALFDRYFQMLDIFYSLPSWARESEDEEDRQEIKDIARFAAEEAKFFKVSANKLRYYL